MIIGMLLFALVLYVFLVNDSSTNLLNLVESIITNKIFDRVDFKTRAPEKGEYEGCRFLHCDFSDSDGSSIRFMDCEFSNCNLSLMKLYQTNFQDTRFIDCKMLGLRFDHCDPFNLSFRFDRCVLNHSSFYQIKIKKTVFKNTQLQEVDFTESDLTAAVFENCDLAKALFDSTMLEQADLRTSFNYSIDPERNRIRKARFSLSAVAGLLDKYHVQIDSRS